jgi:hypothetical protein
VDHVPVHIGAVTLKRTLYNAVIPRWNRWANDFPLHIDQITMRDKHWVILEPRVPDSDVIAKHFYKTGKKGTQTFKSGKTIIHFHVPNEIYDAVLEKKETEEWPADKNTARKPAGRKVTVARISKEIEPSLAADFTVSILIILMPECGSAPAYYYGPFKVQTIRSKLLKWELLLGCCKQREEASPKCLTYI